MDKRRYIVYLVREYDDGVGNITKKRYYAGETYAVSQRKACVNVEYRLRGKAVYGGSSVYDMGSDSALEIYYEAEEA